MTTQSRRPTTPPTPPDQTPDASTRRKPGAPVGNQNARKHNPFYFGDLSADQQARMDRVFQARDLKPEVVMLRMSLVRLLADPATRPSDLAAAVRALASILRSQARLAPPRVKVRTPRGIPGGASSKLGDPQSLHQARHDGLNGPGAGAETIPAKAAQPVENNVDKPPPLVEEGHSGPS